MNMNNYSENFLDLNPGIISFDPSIRNKEHRILYLSPAKYKINNSIEDTIFLKTTFFGRNYGIPEMNEMFGSIRSRATIAFPLDYTNPEIKDFADKINHIESVLTSEDSLKTILPRKAKIKSYENIPIIRSSERSNRPDLIKFRLILSEDDSLATKVCRCNNINHNGNIVPVNTIDELAAMISYNTKIQLIFQFNNFWINTGNRSYGINLKVHQINILTQPSRIRMLTFDDTFDTITLSKTKIKKIVKYKKSKPFECGVCYNNECTKKTTYKCCGKKVCYDCRVTWIKNKVDNSLKPDCPFCRASDSLI